MKLTSQTDHGLSFGSAVFFMVGTIVGAGCLALPKAVDVTGLAGLLLVTAFMLISTYTAILLCKAFSIATTLYSECIGNVPDPYLLLAEKTYGKRCRYLVSFTLFSSLFGFCVTFLLILSENMEQLVVSYGSNIPFCICIVIVAVVIVPFTWFRSPKDFWILGWLTPIAMSVALFILVVNILLDNRDRGLVEHGDLNFFNFATSFGVIFFASSIHQVILTIQIDMKHQSDSPWAMFVAAMLVLLHFYPIIAVGYLVYGKKAEANVFYNSPPGWMSDISLIFFSVHFFLAINILLNPIYQELENQLSIPKEFTWKRCIARTSVIGLVLVAAILIPRFEVLMSLIGGSTLSLLMFVFPVLFYNKICEIHRIHILTMYGDDITDVPKIEEANQMTTLMEYLHLAIVLFGIIAGFIATVSSIISILTLDKRGLSCFVH